MGIKKVKEKNGKRVQREIDEYEAQKNDGTECKKSKLNSNADHGYYCYFCTE